MADDDGPKNLEDISDVPLLPSQQAALRAKLAADTRHMDRLTETLKAAQRGGPPVCIMTEESVDSSFQEHVQLLKNAYMLFLTHSLKPEFNDAARPLIADMTAYPEEWEAFYSHPDNEEWCERSVGVVNTYATWLRQRSEEHQNGGSAQEASFRSLLAECEAVLNMGGRQLRLYKTHAEATRPGRTTLENAAIIKCLKGLTYKYLLIKFNVLRQTGRLTSVNPSEVRFQCQYEFEFYADQYADNPTDYAFNLLTVLGLPITRQALDGVSAKQIRHAYKVLMPALWKKLGSEVPFQREGEGYRHMCGGCGAFEEASKDYLRCGRCMTERYCSKECQVSSWKDHKPVCSARK